VAGKKIFLIYNSIIDINILYNIIYEVITSQLNTGPPQGGEVDGPSVQGPGYFKGPWIC